jgi:hypothetical protein
VTICVTIVPDPRSGCLHVTDNIATTFVAHRCGDCIFSGHTLTLALLSLFWLDHADRGTRPGAPTQQQPAANVPASPIHSCTILTAKRSSRCGPLAACTPIPRKTDILLSCLKIYALVATIAGILAVIASHAHYTVDIVVAIYTAVTVWYAHAYFWSPRPSYCSCIDVEAVELEQVLPQYRKNRKGASPQTKNTIRLVGYKKGVRTSLSPGSI